MADEFVDSSGLNPNDPRHPRWLWPVEPGGHAPGELERALEERGIPFEVVGDPGGNTLHAGRLYVQRWPDKNGLYGTGTAPQYAHRRDGGPRGDLAWLLTHIVVRDVLHS